MARRSVGFAEVILYLKSKFRGNFLRVDFRCLYSFTRWFRGSRTFFGGRQCESNTLPPHTILNLVLEKVGIVLWKSMQSMQSRIGLINACIHCSWVIIYYTTSLILEPVKINDTSFGSYLYLCACLSNRFFNNYIYRYKYSMAPTFRKTKKYFIKLTFQKQFSRFCRTG